MTEILSDLFVLCGELAKLQTVCCDSAAVHCPGGRIASGRYPYFEKPLSMLLPLEKSCPSVSTMAVKVLLSKRSDEVIVQATTKPETLPEQPEEESGEDLDALMAKLNAM